MDVRQSFLEALACTMLIAPQTPPSPDFAETLFQERLASYVTMRDEFSRFAHLPLEPTDERTMTARRTRVGAALRIARAGLASRVLHDDLLIWDFNADVIVDVLPGTFRVETF